MTYTQKKAKNLFYFSIFCDDSKIFVQPFFGKYFVESISVLTLPQVASANCF